MKVVTGLLGLSIASIFLSVNAKPLRLSSPETQEDPEKKPIHPDPLNPQEYYGGPIIGILSTPWSDDGHDEETTQSGFYDHYVRWIEQGGARVVPILYNWPSSQLDAILGSINGLFFTGGELSLLPNTTYYKTARYMYDRALDMNRKGNYFPVWGTCMGFQLISIMHSNDYSVLKKDVFDAEGISLPLHLLEESRHSRMLGSAEKYFLEMIQRENVTSNLHHDGITIEDFHARPELDSFFRVISDNVDLEGQEFVSTIEGKEYPIYAVQWHPERPQFDWIAKNVSHTLHATRAMQYFSNFFVDEARKSEQKFSDFQMQEKALIHNTVPIFKGNSQNLYLWKFDPAKDPLPFPAA